MKIKALLATAALLGLSACGDSSSTDTKKSNSDNNSNKFTYTTDISQCSGEKPAGTNLFRNAWAVTIKSESGPTTFVRYHFKPQHIEVRTKTISNNEKVEAWIVGKARYSQSQIEFMSDRQASMTIKVNGVHKRSTTATEVKSYSVQYSFQGPCLKFTYPDKGDLFLVPAK